MHCNHIGDPLSWQKEGEKRFSRSCIFISHTFNSYLTLFINGIYKIISFNFTQISVFSSTLQVKSNSTDERCLIVRKYMEETMSSSLSSSTTLSYVSQETPQALWMPFLMQCQKLTQAIWFPISTDTHLPQSPHLVNNSMPSATLSLLYMKWTFHASTSEDGVTFLPR